MQEGFLSTIIYSLYLSREKDKILWLEYSGNDRRIRH
jgi:hypothetical protein